MLTMFILYEEELYNLICFRINPVFHYLLCLMLFDSAEYIVNPRYNDNICFQKCCIKMNMLL